MHIGLGVAGAVAAFHIYKYPQAKGADKKEETALFCLTRGAQAFGIATVLGFIGKMI